MCGIMASKFVSIHRWLRHSRIYLLGVLGYSTTPINRGLIRSLSRWFGNRLSYREFPRKMIKNRLQTSATTRCWAPCLLRSAMPYSSRKNPMIITAAMTVICHRFIGLMTFVPASLMRLRQWWIWIFHPSRLVERAGFTFSQPCKTRIPRIPKIRKTVLRFEVERGLCSRCSFNAHFMPTTCPLVIQKWNFELYS